MMPLHNTLERGRRTSRGQPVIALAMILSMWIAVRTTFLAIDAAPASGMESMARLSRPLPPRPAMPDRHSAGLTTLAVPYVPRRSGGAAPRRPPVATADAFAAAAQGQPTALLLRPPPAALPIPADSLGAGSGSFPAENEGARLAYLAPPSAPTGEGPGQTAQPRLPRWSADGWLLLRGDQAPALSAGAAAYGGSQAGAVLRYAFAPASRLRPQAYLRLSSALGASVRQNEAALGVMVRPVRRLPVAVLGEWRLQEQSGQTRQRPVVMAVTELPPLRLPLDAEVEAYAQGGWAGGRGATLFYDLAATLQHRVIRPLPGTQLSAGGGIWSGGQRGAVRFDVGPRIELRGMVGAPSRRIGWRVGVDWRFRVAGRAKPGSGPALTLAAGF